MDDLQTERKGQILAVKDLPTLPTVLDKVTRLVQDPDSSTEEIARVISRDQVLSAKVLKMVNSSIYGFPRRISTVQHALVLLGFNVIRGLIISSSVFDIMAQSMVGLWDHSVGVAVASNCLAKAAGIKDPEEYAVTGLLHDIGKVVVAVQLPGSRQEIDDQVTRRDLSYYDAEKVVLGFSHDRINAWLADHWNLPLNLREGLAWHHRPQSARHYPDMAHVVHVADFLVKTLEVGNSGDDQVPYLEKNSLKALGLTLQDLDGVLDRVIEEVADLESMSPELEGQAG